MIITPHRKIIFLSFSGMLSKELLMRANAQRTAAIKIKNINRDAVSISK